MKVCLIVCLFMTALMGKCGGYPSDQVMTERLRLNEVQFNRLVELFKEDQEVAEVNREFAKSSWDTRVIIPTLRMEEYRKLLTSLQVDAIGRWGTQMIYFKAWENPGFLIGGSSKFFVYAESEPPRLVDSIDRIASQGSDASVFMKVKGNWYLHWDVW